MCWNALWLKRVDKDLIGKCAKMDTFKWQIRGPHDVCLVKTVKIHISFLQIGGPTKKSYQAWKSPELGPLGPAWPAPKLGTGRRPNPKLHFCRFENSRPTRETKPEETYKKPFLRVPKKLQKLRSHRQPTGAGPRQPCKSLKPTGRSFGIRKKNYVITVWTFALNIFLSSSFLASSRVGHCWTL